MSIYPSPRALRAARLRAGHTLKQAAETVHVTLGAWHRWEQGEHRVSATAAHLYALLTNQEWPLPEPPKPD